MKQRRKNKGNRGKDPEAWPEWCHIGTIQIGDNPYFMGIRVDLGTFHWGPGEETHYRVRLVSAFDGSELERIMFDFALDRVPGLVDLLENVLDVVEAKAEQDGDYPGEPEFPMMPPFDPDDLSGVH